MNEFIYTYMCCRYRTMYPYTSAIVLNALKPDPKTGMYNEFSMTVFGGAVSAVLG